MAEDKPIVPEIDGSQNQSTEKSGVELPRIRTYAADMSKAIKSRGETLASIVNKEKTVVKRQAERQTSRSLPLRTIAITVGTVVLVLAGVGVLSAIFIFNPRDAAEVQSSGIIFANEITTITTSTDRLFIDQLAAVRVNQNLSLGEVLRIDLTQNGMPVTGSALASRIGLPDALAREVTEAMVGIHAFDRNQPFIILRVATYDRSFGALLEWERDMGRELSGFFEPTSASGNPPLLTFTDEIVQNLDVRKSGDEWPIIYTFPNQDLLIITTNEFTLREIITRLGSSSASF